MLYDRSLLLLVYKKVIYLVIDSFTTFLIIVMFGCHTLTSFRGTSPQGEAWYTLFVHVCNIPSANSVYLAPPSKEMPRDEASHTYDVVVIDCLVTLLQEPGRIWPGKKMPGRMGGKRVTVPSLKVLL